MKKTIKKEILDLCDEWFCGGFMDDSGKCPYCKCSILDHSHWCPVIKYEEIKERLED